MSRATTVYGIFRDLTPVYIGISYDPKKRLTVHKSIQPWWSDDLRMRPLLTLENRDKALAIEAELAEQLDPEYQDGPPPLTDAELDEVRVVIERIASGN